MAVPSKTGDQVALPWTNVATANVSIGNVIDISDLFAIAVFAQIGRNPGSGAFTTGWPNIRVEVSPKSSGNDLWYPLYLFSPVVGSSLGNTTLNGAIAAGAPSALLASATNFAAGDLVFLGHTSDTTKYELVRVKSVSGNTINFWEPCTYAHDSGAVVTDQAEEYASPILDVSALMRMRVVVDNVGSGQTIAVQSQYSQLDSIG
jgi:hypothetical protein